MNKKLAEALELYRRGASYGLIEKCCGVRSDDLRRVLIEKNNAKGTYNKRDLEMFGAARDEVRSICGLAPLDR